MTLFGVAMYSQEKSDSGKNLMKNLNNGGDGENERN